MESTTRWTAIAVGRAVPSAAARPTHSSANACPQRRRPALDGMDCGLIAGSGRPFAGSYVTPLTGPLREPPV